MDHSKLRQIKILMVDEDHKDRALAKEALHECRLSNKVSFIDNGQELIDYLTHKGQFNKNNAQKPDLILMDLNMPNKAGRKALKTIKKDACLSRIPIVIMTSSKLEQEVVRSFEFGVAGYINKPFTFEKMIPVIKSIGKYYFEIVIHPRDEEK